MTDRERFAVIFGDDVVKDIYQREILTTITTHVKRLMDEQLTGTMSIDFRGGGVTYVDISISPTYLPETVLDVKKWYNEVMDLDG